jgi:hypothetical protein
LPEFVYEKIKWSILCFHRDRKKSRRLTWADHCQKRVKPQTFVRMRRTHGSGVRFGCEPGAPPSKMQNLKIQIILQFALG